MTEQLDTAAIELASKDASDTLALLTEFVVENDDDQEFAAAELHKIKQTHKVLDAERKRATKPQNEALAVINGWFKPALTTLLECERVLKGKISGYMLAREEANKKAFMLAAESDTMEQAAEALATVTAVAAPAGVQVRKKWAWEIINPDLVPAEYWVIDAAKVTAAMRETIARDGEPEPVPGIKFFQEQGLAARRT